MNISPEERERRRQQGRIFFNSMCTRKGAAPTKGKKFPRRICDECDEPAATNKSLDSRPAFCKEHQR